MPGEKPDLPVIKRAPILSAPTADKVAKWAECLRLYDQVIDKTFAIELQNETLAARALYASQNGVILPIQNASTLEQQLILLRNRVIQTGIAINGVRRWEYGLKWRDGDFDILNPNATMSALFIPIILGGLVLAGCFATLYHMGESSDKLLVDYQKLNKAANAILCKDPDSTVCKGWQVAKVEQKIEEKESFADALKGGLSKGVSVALALVGGMLALSFLKR